MPFLRSKFTPTLGVVWGQRPFWILLIREGSLLTILTSIMWTSSQLSRSSKPCPLFWSTWTHSRESSEKLFKITLSKTVSIWSWGQLQKFSKPLAIRQRSHRSEITLKESFKQWKTAKRSIKARLRSDTLQVSIEVLRWILQYKLWTLLWRIIQRRMRIL